MINLPHPTLPGVTVTTPIYAGTEPQKFQECEAGSGPRDVFGKPRHEDKHQWPDGLPEDMTFDEEHNMMMGVQTCKRCQGTRAIFCPSSNPAVKLAKRRALLDKIKTNVEARALLLAEVDLWQDVEELGYKPNTVASFGFNPDKLHKGPLRKLWQFGTNRNIVSKDNPFFAPLEGGGHRLRWYNILKMKDGTEVVLQHALLAPQDRLEHHFTKELGQCPLPPSSPAATTPSST